MNHDCCGNSGKKSKSGKTDPFIMGIIGVTVLVLGAGIFMGLKAGAVPQVSADSSVSLTAATKIFDWGNINYDGGVVDKSFPIKNTSTSVLKLYDVKTSCMCTTAQLKTPEKTSRKYGMHETTTDITEVKPGETADLIVEFDPAFHGPSGIGPISRTVTLNTNDPKNPTLSFYLSGTVYKK